MCHSQNEPNKQAHRRTAMNEEFIRFVVGDHHRSIPTTILYLPSSSIIKKHETIGGSRVSFNIEVYS